MGGREQAGLVTAGWAEGETEHDKNKKKQRTFFWITYLRDSGTRFDAFAGMAMHESVEKSVEANKCVH